MKASETILRISYTPMGIYYATYGYIFYVTLRDYENVALWNILLLIRIDMCFMILIIGPGSPGVML